MSIFSFSFMASADGIEFQKLDWKKNLAQASAENKMIYVDFYTTWCGPCKFMANKYFPTKEAGDFYNKNFFCLKIDAEKEGLELAKQYAVNGYPTNLFINPKNEEIVYKTMGAPSDLAGFLKNGATAVEEFNDPMTLEQYAEKMEKGNTTKEFTMQYLKKLTRLDQPNQWPLDVYTSTYFNKTIGDEECAFMDEYLKDINNNTFQIFKNNKKAYNAYAEKEHPSYTWQGALTSKLYTTNEMATRSNNGQLFRTVVKTAEELLPASEQMSMTYYLTKTFSENNDSVMHIKNEYDYADKLMNAKESYHNTQDAEALASVLKQLEWQSKEWPPNMVTKLDSMKNAFSKDKKYTKMATARAASQLNSAAWFAFENDGDKYPKALEWAEKAYALSKESESSVAATADTYANLLFVSGKKSEAIKIQKEAIQKLEEDGEDATDYKATLKKFMGQE